MRHLALAFCSVHPTQYPPEIQRAREVEYEVCLRQLRRVLPASFDLVVCENTLPHLDVLAHAPLRDWLGGEQLLLLGQNLGTRNKGVGELQMLHAAITALGDGPWQNAAYCTARRIFTCPYVFERTERLTRAALLSNPDFLYVDGRFVATEKAGMFNDMFFAMRAPVMRRYAEWSHARLPQLIERGVGSEQNLYEFVIEHDLDYEWLDWLGMVRNDWEVTRRGHDLANFHLC